MTPRRLLARLRRGEFTNVRFTDALRLARRLGFDVARIRGSHHILEHRRQPIRLNLQEVRGQAKPYQLRQLLDAVDAYHLRLEEDA